MKVLVDVRNAFIHFKPEWSSIQDKHKKLGQRLHDKITCSPFVSEHEPIFPKRCMSCSTAQWAFDTAYNFMTDFAEETGLPNHFENFFDNASPANTDISDT